MVSLESGSNPVSAEPSASIWLEPRMPGRQKTVTCGPLDCEETYTRRALMPVCSQRLSECVSSGFLFTVHRRLVMTAAVELHSLSADWDAHGIRIQLPIEASGAFMTYQMLLLYCECGEPAGQIQDVGFTGEHDLIVHWQCSACDRDVYAIKSLSDCWGDCPTPEPAAPPEPAVSPEPPAAEATDESDAILLHGLGVRMPDPK